MIDRRDKVRYVLIIPFCGECRILIIFWFISVSFGPVFSYQVRSNVCVAIVCPHFRLIWGIERWRREGK